MGAKSNKGSKKQLKVLVLGVSGSGKTTFIKQMKIIHHGGFSSEEVAQYKEIMCQNVLVGMQELLKQANKLEILLQESSRKYIRSIQAVVPSDFQWDENIQSKIQALWDDPGVQQVWKEATHYQLQVNHMDYLMANVQRFSKSNFVPTNEDILLARQRTTGEYRTILKKDKCKWELIDVGGQAPERAKWEEVTQEGLTAIIFFAGLDEYNMASSEEKHKTKMEVAQLVFTEIMNSESSKGVTKLLFLNKVDLFRKKMADKNQFKEFQTTFKDYKADNDPDTAAEFVADKFRSLIETEGEQLHHHVVCALDTTTMAAVFEAVKQDIFVKKIEMMNVTL